MKALKPSFLICTTGSPHRCSQKRFESSVRQELSVRQQEIGVQLLELWVRQMAGNNRLPCGYLYPSSHWKGKSMGGLHAWHLHVTHSVCWTSLCTACLS